MSNRDMKLLMENWRSFINESAGQENLDEGLKEKITQFIITQIKPKVEKFIIELDQAKKEVAPQQVKQKLIGDEKFAKTIEAAKVLSQNLNNTKQLSEALNLVFSTRKSLLEFHKYLLDSNKKILKENDKEQVEEVGLVAGTGLALGAIGGVVLLLKGAVKVAPYLGVDINGTVFGVLKKCLVAAETFEAAVKQLLGYFTDASASLFTYLSLDFARSSDGWFRKRFAQAGLKLLINSRVPKPPFKVFTRATEAGRAFSDDYLSWSSAGRDKLRADVGHHIQHDAEKTAQKIKNMPAVAPTTGDKMTARAFESLNRLEQIIFEETKKILLEADGAQQATQAKTTNDVAGTMVSQTAAGAKTKEQFDAVVKEFGFQDEESFIEAIRKEIQILVKLNREIGYHLLLFVLAAVGVAGLLEEGLHGLLGWAEAGASGVKGAEIGVGAAKVAVG